MHEIKSMVTPIQSIEKAAQELADIHAEVLRLERKIEGVRETVQRAAAEASVSNRQVSSLAQASIPVNHHRWTGHPLKTNPELTANVQAALNLETKKEAEIVIGAVVDVLEHTLLNNLSNDGFSMKLGGFGNFKVR
jgi:outer membrane murein-binding lipoprotein Lpp